MGYLSLKMQMVTLWKPCGGVQNCALWYPEIWDADGKSHCERMAAAAGTDQSQSVGQADRKHGKFTWKFVKNLDLDNSI